MVLTPSIRGVSACRHATVWSWARFMAHTLSMRCLRSSSCIGLYLGSYLWLTHLLSEVSPLVMKRFVLGLISWPTHLLSEVSLSVMKRSHPPSSGMSPMTLRFSTTMWTWERSLPSHRKRELRRTLRNLPSHFLCLELLCLSD